MEKFKVSVVIPAYNEAENISPLLERLLPVLQKYNDYEVIFVDDGSSDTSLEVLERCHTDNAKIHLLRARLLHHYQ